jgi:hypothetical protein
MDRLAIQEFANKFSSRTDDNSEVRVGWITLIPRISDQCLDCNQADFCSYKSSVPSIEDKDPNWRCPFKSEEW